MVKPSKAWVGHSLTHWTKIEKYSVENQQWMIPENNSGEENRKLKGLIA